MGDISSKTLRDFHVPDYILVPGSKVRDARHIVIPSCPLMVFINTKSGGQQGGEILKTYRALLNKNQVIDLGEKAPDKVLRQLYVTLQTLKNNRDILAAEIEKRLRLIVAGGDGTASWLLEVVSDLKLPQPPPIATVPLGTGNNLHFSFGWGKRNPGTDRQTVLSFLSRVRSAKEMKVDSWRITVRMKATKEGSCHPIGPLELPPSMHAVHRVSQRDTKDADMDGFLTYRGGFWNYFSMGMDAQVSYAFHSERKLHPEKYKSQFVNQSTYLKLVCTQGWFCTSLFHPNSRNISQLTKVIFMKRQGQWEELQIPKSIRSIICLNLPSFSGGLDPWGKPNGRKQRDRDLTSPYVDDGLLEIVGFRDAWHGLVILNRRGHGTRLAQARGIRFEFHKGQASETFMRIDGEPWKQPLPLEDEKVVIEISHSGQVNMLATPTCRSKSVNDPSLPPNGTHDHEGGEEDDDDDEDSSSELECSQGSEEQRKYGATNTFKLPDDFDLSHLS